MVPGKFSSSRHTWRQSYGADFYVSHKKLSFRWWHWFLFQKIWLNCLIVGGGTRHQLLRNFVKSPVIEPKRQTGDFFGAHNGIIISMMALISFQKVWLNCLIGGGGIWRQLLGNFVKSPVIKPKRQTGSLFGAHNGIIISMMALISFQIFSFKIAWEEVPAPWIFVKSPDLEPKPCKGANLWRTHGIFISMMALISFSKNLAWKTNKCTS